MEGIIATVIGLLTPVLSFFSTNYGTVGTVIFYAIFVVGPIVSVLIEIAELIATYTATKKDDEVVAKIHKYWDMVIAALELVPHVNVPLAAGIQKAVEYITKGSKAIIGAIRGWFGSGQ